MKSVKNVAADNMNGNAVPAGRLMLVLVAAVAVSALATVETVAGERILLWPEGKMPDAQPQQIAAFLQEQEAPGFDPNEHRFPYIEWMPPPAKPNGVCMILISGGGYRRLADAIHVRIWNERFTAIGCQCVTLVYRTPRPEGVEIWRTAWDDGQRAVRLVRRDARKRGFDPEKIGTMSHSAGSHLALLLCTSSQTPAYAPVDDLDREVSCHVNFAVTGAIAYGLVNEKGKGAAGARLDTCFKFDAKTAPMCMFHGCVDPITPLSSTYAYRELRRHKVSAELHLFADRKHGFYGNNPNKPESTAYDNWFGRACEFMTQLGFLGELEKEVPLMERFPNDFHDAAKYEKRNLWPDGKMPYRQLKENGADAQCTPYLEWYVPAKLSTKAVQIVFSGGAYKGNNPNGFEVAPIRRYLNEKGMAVVTMRYRTPRPKDLPKHVTAWADLQRCIRLVRAEAPKRGLDSDRIGIMGSSAGGHLTLMGATSSCSPAYPPIDEIDKIPCNVQWAVAVYPAYVLAEGANSPCRDGGLGNDSTLVSELAFDESTCPMLFLHGDSDVHSAMGSVMCWERMRRMDIGCDLHTLVRRGHTFQKTASPGTGSYTWMDRIWEFMNHKKFNR